MRGERATGWRRIAGAIWPAPRDPQIFGALEVDAAPIHAFIAEARTRGEHITPTHLVGRAVAHALTVVPEVNVQLRGARIVPRDSVDVFFITAVRAGQDLSGIKVTHADQRSVSELAHEVAARRERLVAGRDPAFARTKRLMNALPPRALRLALRGSSLVTQVLRRDIPFLGLEKNPFGSAMVSSVGMLGIPQGFAPLSWMYDVPVLVLVGEITQKAVVRGGAIVARSMLPITATIDHRYVDGSHISRLMAAFSAYLAAPARFEPRVRTTSSSARPR